MKQSLILGLSFIINIHIICMDTKLIEIQNSTTPTLYIINGEEKYMIGHVYAAQSDSKSPFSVTRLIRYTNDCFVDQGDIQSIKEKDFDDIIAENFVYAPNFAKRKTRISPSNSMNIDALILGTKDQSLVAQLMIQEFNSLTEYILRSQKLYKKYPTNFTQKLMKLKEEFPHY